MTWLDRDRRHCWHPFTQVATAPPPLPVVGAEGAWLELDDGRRLFDGLSSWWSTLHGHCHPRLQRAIADQAGRLDHVLFAGCTHPPAVELAERLAAAAPGALDRVFFSDDGSTAVEVALKMAFQLFHNRGAPRRGFLCLEGGYHGDTIGAMSAGDPSTFGEPFEPLLFPVTRVAPPLLRDHRGTHDDVDAALAQVDGAFAANPGEIAAVVLEPMVQGAAGMRMMPPAYLRGLRERCTEHGALLIVDEVMTGFGRTGRRFAVDHAGVEPDLMCLSKGITGGTLPLAATVAPTWLHDAFLDEDMRRGFLHGHTYTANPIACAAAVASWDLLEEEGLLRAKVLEDVYAELLPPLAAHPRVASVRWLGTIGVVELAEGDGYYAPVRRRVQDAMVDAGYLVRPLGPVVYTMPPLCATPEEIRGLYAALGEVLDAL